MLTTVSGRKTKPLHTRTDGNLAPPISEADTTILSHHLQLALPQEFFLRVSIRSVPKSLKLMFPLGLVKGLNEVCKALDRKEAVLCVLAENCDDPKYKKLITALAKANSIPVITIENRNDIGEWLGHCKYDKEGKARKVKGTSSVAIKDFGEETAALAFVLNHIKEKNL